MGTHGFAEGGFIVDGGKLTNEPISPLACRLEIPPDWRFVLISHRPRIGLSGTREQSAFDALPPVPAEITCQLQTELRDHLLPAVAQGCFEQFADSLHRFGRLAGSCLQLGRAAPTTGRS